LDQDTEISEEYFVSLFPNNIKPGGVHCNYYNIYQWCWSLLRHTRPVAHSQTDTSARSFSGWQKKVWFEL